MDTAHTTPQQSGKMLSKPIVFSPGARDGKRKKLELREVFNADEDDNAAQPQRKRKLVPLGKSQLVTVYFKRNYRGITSF